MPTNTVPQDTARYSYLGFAAALNLIDMNDGTVYGPRDVNYMVNLHWLSVEVLVTRRRASVTGLRTNTFNNFANDIDVRLSWVGVYLTDTHDRQTDIPMMAIVALA